MPVIRPNLDGGGEKRTTFRPPWVKDGPCPLPAPPVNPWLQQAKQEKKDLKSAAAPVPVLKKPKEKEVKINVETGIGKADGRPKERELKVEERSKEETRNEPAKKGLKEKEGQAKKVDFKMKPEERVVKEEERVPGGNRAREAAPGPPPPPPMAPPLPPPPPTTSQEPKKPISKEKAAKLEALRSRPRRRPDWTDMMKEVEEGIKLKHVKCNDRSAPVIPKAKAKGQFVYESEKEKPHHQLLKEIQQGVHLKKVKTNDRSKPILEGLRKFRRQMTIEEIITKSASVADVVAVAAQPDELDDIDKVRDDLQSTKQMLALELRNKEALERENKRLLARLANLEAELEKEKLARNLLQQGNAKVTRSAEDDKLITRLKEEASESAKMTKEMEDKYHKTAEELDLTRAKLESAWLKNAQLEMELKTKGNFRPPLAKQASSKKISNSRSQNAVNQQPGGTRNEEDSDTVTETESEEEEEEEDVNDTTAATQEERELKLLNNKLRTLRDKKISATNEKKNLKSQLSKLQKLLKEEKKKYKVLQSEVEKMASLMKDVEGDEEEEEKEPNEDEEDDEEEETETESESEEEESEEELPENVSHHEKVRHLNAKIKSYETLLTREKKGNYLLKVNIERKQDDLNRQKEMSLALQEDLNAVLSELG